MSLLGYVRERREACVRLHRVLSATAFLLVLVLPRFAKKRGVWFPAADGRDEKGENAVVKAIVRSSDDTATGNVTKDYRERWKLVNKNGWKLNERVSTEALR